MPLKSSASSVTNLDLNEGILVHDLDRDVDTPPAKMLQSATYMT